MSDSDLIGVVRAHRWASVEEQRSRLHADGVKRIVDLKDRPREYVVGLIRERSTLVLLYAFLLAEPKLRKTDMMRDFTRFADRIAKLPRGCHGFIRDIHNDLTADTPGRRRALNDVVEKQLARHKKGLHSVDNAKQGAPRKEFTETEWAKFEAIWRNVEKYPTWDHADAAFKAINPDFTKWRANAEWPRRKFEPKRNTD